ncbi:hypothetical protein [Planktothrix paucivesiculata]|uniref:Glycerophosphoryl diester phosphodiesterase membrane domain-containing protein n=1 Tax=Planktothrix paucivesiculata PCC 9631 TaxID=671071 RepID=A0A7Z9BXY7_9CYAN|nr:hypothetical protein [Planktothrix paucivesiculata]VXD22047.1 membrane hypothetical protein [Planktothrix paucivesiculata PCC 9631]
MINKIREAMGLLSANFILLSSIVLTVWLPGSILLVYLRLYVFPETSGGDELRIFMQEYRVSNAIQLAFEPLYVGAILYAVSQLKQGLSVTYQESMTYAARRSFKVLGTRIGAALIMLPGFIFFVIPGIIIALRFALIDAVVVLEGVAGKSARKLSSQLTQGKRWHILGTIIVTFIGILIAIVIVSLILYLPLLILGKDEHFLIAVINECIINILLIIPTIVLFLFYWEAKNQRTISSSDQDIA